MLPLRMFALLVLMLSLCDAGGTCPNLTTDPTEVLEEYGASVLVNCSSDTEDHSGMYWRVGPTHSAMEYDNSFILLALTLSDWNLTAECKMNLDETNECSKDLKVTVYKNPEMVTMFPIKYSAMVEGTQYELQCDVIDVAPVQNLTITWYRDNQTIRTDSFTKTTKKLVSESSILVVNISRQEDKARFRCEAQLDFGPHGSQPPVSSEVHTVSVHYAPEPKNETEDVFVYEGDHVMLNCEADGRPPPVFHWTRDGTDLMEPTNNLNITGVTDATYNCIATNYLGNSTKQIHVHMTKTNAAPAALTTPQPSTPKSCPLVLTPAELVVRFGGPASANCSTSAANVSIIGWEATFGGAVATDTHVITWAVEKLKDWTIKPLCFINMEDNNQCFEMLNVTLYKTPDFVLVSALAQVPMVEGTEHSLLCVVNNVAPVHKLHLTWYRGNETVHTQTFNNTKVTPDTVSSILRVTPTRDYNGNLFRCEAKLLLGPHGPEPAPTVTSPPYVAVVHYAPQIKVCPDHYAGVELKFSMDQLPCEADGNPTPTVHWSYADKLINASESLSRTQSGNYTAEIANVLGRIFVSVLITVEYGPSFSCDDEYEVEENGFLQWAPDGIPEPTVTWFKDDKKMASQPRWTKHDSGTYKLEAINMHGRASCTLRVNVLYAPVFTQGNYSQEAKPGDNVTFGCSAHSNPPSKIQWKYTASAVNVGTPTRGSQNSTSISITGATSTNAGVYSCVATNKIGRVSRTVTLIITDRLEPSKANFTVIWWLLIFLVATLILILIIGVYRWRKHGQYTFVPDKANDFPMSTRTNGAQT